MLSALELRDPASLSDRIDAYVAGSAPLSGLELYYELERSTSLLEFHTMLRAGPRNRARSGLQQSYGDHNRLLMLALDELLEGDVGWFRARLDPDDPVPDDALARSVGAVAEAGLTRDVVVALWLAAALHDCGMLCDHGALVDVEDGIVLSRPIIDALCPERLRDLATFVLHHHDYVKGVFLGEVPASLVARALESLGPDLRSAGLLGLGLVQVAGAASLGEGRLGAFRIEIFDRCLDGTALDDRSPSTRAHRLGVDPDGLVPFLEEVAIHGWTRATAPLAPGERAAALAALAERWEGSGAEHVVFADGCPRWTAPPPADRIRGRVEHTLSGVSLLVVEG